MGKANKTSFKKGHKVNQKYKYPEGMTPQQAYYWRNREKCRSQAKERIQEYRIKALTHYGNGIPHCNCCGEETIEFLSFDHINGGGTKHRKKIGGGIALFLIKNDYPNDYQVLCHNCNQAKGFYGQCPHQRDTIKT